MRCSYRNIFQFFFRGFYVDICDGFLKEPRKVLRKVSNLVMQFSNVLREIFELFLDEKKFLYAPIQYRIDRTLGSG